MSRLLFLLAVVAAAQAPPGGTFQTGTRLVEVEVVVRDQRVRPPGVGAWFAWTFDSGPPFGPPGLVHTGLAQSDFSITDDGKPQTIAVFKIGPGESEKPAVLTPGAVSNRQDNGGHAVTGATAILVDFLNTRFGCLGYEQLGMKRLVSSFAENGSRAALYTLGTKLHVLHDFTDDPRVLKQAAASMNRGGDPLRSDFEAALNDLGDVIAVGGGESTVQADRVHVPMTLNAARLIIQHLAGVPGRKNLVWMMEDPQRVPPAAVALARQANIVLYPVLVRLTGGGIGPDDRCGGGSIHAIEDLAALTGGRAFYAALDLGSAVRSTEEDTTTAYILGYYPPAEMLDGTFHTLAVKLRGQASNLEMYYRPGYIATRTPLAPPAPTLAELFKGPLDVTGIGLTGEAAPEREHPGRYDLRLTVDLHDIRSERKGGRFAGSFDLSIPNPAEEGTVRTGTVAFNLEDRQFAEALERGYPVSVTGAEAQAGQIRIAVRDRATGLAGSLRIQVDHP